MKNFICGFWIPMEKVKHEVVFSYKTCSALGNVKTHSELDLIKQVQT